MKRLSLPRRNYEAAEAVIGWAAELPKNSLPTWMTLPSDAKLPMIHGPKDNVLLHTTNMCEKKHRSVPELDFGLTFPYCQTMPNDYDPLHDPHLKPHLHTAHMRKRLRERGFITRDGKVVCTVRKYNEYRQYLHEVNLAVNRKISTKDKSARLHSREARGDDVKGTHEFRVKQIKARQHDQLEIDKARHQRLVAEDEVRKACRREMQVLQMFEKDKRLHEDQARQQVMIYKREKKERDKKINILSHLEEKDNMHRSLVNKRLKEHELERARKLTESWEERKRVQQITLAEELRLRLLAEEGKKARVTQREWAMRQKHQRQASIFEKMTQIKREERRKYDEACVKRITERMEKCRLRAENNRSKVHNKKNTWQALKSNWDISQSLLKMFSECGDTKNQNPDDILLPNLTDDTKKEAAMQQCSIRITTEVDEHVINRYAHESSSSEAHKLGNGEISQEQVDNLGTSASSDHIVVHDIDEQAVPVSSCLSSLVHSDVSDALDKSIIEVSSCNELGLNGNLTLDKEAHPSGIEVGNFVQTSLLNAIQPHHREFVDNSDVESKTIATKSPEFLNYKRGNSSHSCSSPVDIVMYNNSEDEGILPPVFHLEYLDNPDQLRVINSFPYLVNPEVSEIPNQNTSSKISMINKLERAVTEVKADQTPIQEKTSSHLFLRENELLEMTTGNISSGKISPEQVDNLGRSASSTHIARQDIDSQAVRAPSCISPLIRSYISDTLDKAIQEVSSCSGLIESGNLTWDKEAYPSEIEVGNFVQTVLFKAIQSLHRDCTDNANIDSKTKSRNSPEFLNDKRGELLHRVGSSVDTDMYSDSEDEVNLQQVFDLEDTIADPDQVCITNSFQCLVNPAVSGIPNLSASSTISVIDHLAVTEVMEDQIPISEVTSSPLHFRKNELLETTESNILPGKSGSSDSSQDTGYKSSIMYSPNSCCSINTSPRLSSCLKRPSSESIVIPSWHLELGSSAASLSDPHADMSACSPFVAKPFKDEELDEQWSPSFTQQTMINPGLHSN